MTEFPSSRVDFAEDGASVSPKYRNLVLAECTLTAVLFSSLVEHRNFTRLVNVSGEVPRTTQLELLVISAVLSWAANQLLALPVRQFTDSIPIFFSDIIVNFLSCPFISKSR